jgi:hypothetical protein
MFVTGQNYTGFSEIAKKWDRKFPKQKGRFKGKICDEGKQNELLASKMVGCIISIFWIHFCILASRKIIECLCLHRKKCIQHGSAKVAFLRLRPRCFPKGMEFQLDVLFIHPKLYNTLFHLVFCTGGNRRDGLLMYWTQLHLGCRLGMCNILALWVAWDCIWGVLEKGQVSIAARTAFPVFRGCFGLVVWHWFWGMSVYVWRRYRINYIYLFKFNPRNVDAPIDIFNEAADELLLLLICMLLYYKAINTKLSFDHVKIMHL